MKNSLLCAAILSLAAPTRADPLLLVGNKGEDTVSIIDLETGQEIARPAVSGSAPHEIAPSPDGAQFAVVNYGDNDIDIFDVASRSLIQTVDLGEDTRPHGLVWLSDDRIVATTEGNNSIVVIAPDRSVRSFGTGKRGTHMVAVTSGGVTAFTADMGSGTVSRIDLESGDIMSADAGQEPEGIAITPDGREVWVSARGDNTVRVFDADTLERLSMIEVGRFPLRITLSPDGRHAVTSNLFDGSLSVIDVESRKVLRTLSVSGEQASGQVTLLFSEDGQTLYAAETGTDSVAEVDFVTGEVRRRLKAGRNGDGLAIVPDAASASD